MRAERPRSVAGVVTLAALLFAGSAGRVYADPPADWGGGGEGYELSRDDAVKHGGNASGSVKATGDGTMFGTFTQAIRADKYRGKRLRMTAFVKCEGVEGQAGLWMRVDGKDKTGIAFDNMQKRPIKGSADWKKYDVVLDIAQDAEEIYFGFLLAGKGQAWVDDIAFDVVGDDVAATDLKIPPSDRVGEPANNLPEEPKNLDFER